MAKQRISVVNKLTKMITQIRQDKVKPIIVKNIDEEDDYASVISEYAHTYANRCSEVFEAFIVGIQTVLSDIERKKLSRTEVVTAFNTIKSMFEVIKPIMNDYVVCKGSEGETIIAFTVVVPNNGSTYTLNYDTDNPIESRAVEVKSFSAILGGTYKDPSVLLRSAIVPTAITLHAMRRMMSRTTEQPSTDVLEKLIRQTVRMCCFKISDELKRSPTKRLFNGERNFQIGIPAGLIAGNKNDIQYSTLDDLIEDCIIITKGGIQSTSHPSTNLMLPILTFIGKDTLNSNQLSVHTSDVDNIWTERSKSLESVSTALSSLYKQG